MKKYVVVTGDLIGSQEMPNRREVQSQLKTALAEVNHGFKGTIVVPFVITLGDEFQGAINSLAESYTIIKNLRKEIYPVAVRFGVGCGGISTEIGSTPAEMDGEAFYLSRQALESARKGKRKIQFSTGDEVRDNAVNTILMLIEAIQSDWKEKHYQRVWAYERLGTLEKVAEREGISRQAITETMKSIKYEQIKTAEESLLTLLRECTNFSF